jgi:hypothetical protein
MSYCCQRLADEAAAAAAVVIKGIATAINCACDCWEHIFLNNLRGKGIFQWPVEKHSVV